MNGCTERFLFEDVKVFKQLYGTLKRFYYSVHDI